MRIEKECESQKIHSLLLLLIHLKYFQGCSGSWFLLLWLLTTVCHCSCIVFAWSSVSVVCKSSVWRVKIKNSCNLRIMVYLMLLDEDDLRSCFFIRVSRSSFDLLLSLLCFEARVLVLSRIGREEYFNVTHFDFCLLTLKLLPNNHFFDFVNYNNETRTIIMTMMMRVLNVAVGVKAVGLHTWRDSQYKRETRNGVRTTVDNLKLFLSKGRVTVKSHTQLLGRRKQNQESLTCDTCFSTPNLLFLIFFLVW